MSNIGYGKRVHFYVIILKKKSFPVDNQNEFAILNKQLVMINYDCLGDQVIFRKNFVKIISTILIALIQHSFFCLFISKFLNVIKVVFN